MSSIRTNERRPSGGLRSVRGLHQPTPDAPADPFTGRPPERLDVEVLYRLVGLPEPGRDVPPGEMLFTLADAHARLREIFQSWLDRQDLLGPVFARYFHIVHSGSTSREHEFESYTRALETHHRRTAAMTDVSDEEHEARLGTIYAAVPEEHHAFLERRLAYSNEPSLSQRLKATLARCPVITERLVGNSDARSRFVRRVVATRNYETHLDPSIEGEAAQGRELFLLTLQLRALVEMTLLLEIGFTCDDASAFLYRPRRYELLEER